MNSTAIVTMCLMASTMVTIPSVAAQLDPDTDHLSCKSAKKVCPIDSTTRPPTTRPTRPLTTRPTHPPTTRPTRPPTTRPTRPLTTHPTRPHTTRPTHPPTTRPTRPPTTHPPTTRPTRPPTTRPPTTRPTRPPTTRPTRPPTTCPPTTRPTRPPTTHPTRPPTTRPTRPPTTRPTIHPTMHPPTTHVPTIHPITHPPPTTHPITHAVSPTTQSSITELTKTFITQTDCEDCIVCGAMSEGLIHYPTTLAPVSGSVTVTTQCADNAHIFNSTSLNVTCTSNGSWSGETPQCQCDEGYHEVSVNGTLTCQDEIVTMFHHSMKLHMLISASAVCLFLIISLTTITVVIILCQIKFRKKKPMGDVVTCNDNPKAILDCPKNRTVIPVMPNNAYASYNVPRCTKVQIYPNEAYVIVKSREKKLKNVKDGKESKLENRDIKVPVYSNEAYAVPTCGEMKPRDRKESQLRETVEMPVFRNKSYAVCNAVKMSQEFGMQSRKNMDNNNMAMKGKGVKP